VAANIILLAVVLSTPAQAQAAPAVPDQNGHIIDEIASLFATATQGFQQSAHTAAVQIFKVAFGFEVIVVGFEIIAPEATMRDIVWRIALLLVAFGMGQWLLGNMVALSNEAMTDIPTLARTFFLPGTSQAGTSPGDLAALFDAAADHLSATIGPNPIVDLAVGISSTIAGIALQWGGMLLGIELAVGIVGFQFAVAIVSILLGFVGCRFTRHFSHRWLGVLVNGALMLIAIDCVASVGMFAVDYINGMTDAMGQGGLGGMRSDVGKIAAAAVAFFAFAMGLPAFVSYLGASGMTGAATGVFMRFTSMAVGAGMAAGGAIAAGSSALASGASDKAAIATLSAATKTTP
jgi:hypothetical protein